jgi:hypothetical protein
MASVLLPTTTWTDGCDDVVADLRPEDELIVVADRSDDPALDGAPESATTLVAGDPVGCAGKANALAEGMERASQDVVLWTDDDVARDPGWRDRLVENARESGAATEVPVYVGSGLWSLFEPAMALFGSLGMASSGKVWGGGVAFDRTELDEEELLSELRQTVGDDSVLSNYVEDPWVDADHPREVRVGGSPSAVYHRMARFAKATFYFEPLSTGVLLCVSVVVAALCLLFPFVGLPATTGLGLWTYRKLGVSRASVALSFPSFVVVPLAIVVGLLAPAFEWGGRRYRWRGRFEVSVLGRS